MPPGAKNKRKQRLWAAQNGLCCYCDVKMLHWDDWKNSPALVAKYGNPPKAKSMPLTLATLEHLNDRFHPLRRTPANGAKRLALACWECNNKRGIAAVKAVIQQRRARRVTTTFHLQKRFRSLRRASWILLGDALTLLFYHVGNKFRQATDRGDKDHHPNPVHTEPH